MSLSIIDKCNEALLHFGFYEIQQIEPETINIVNACFPSTYKGFTNILQGGNTALDQGFQLQNSKPLFWYYLHLKDEKNWNFLFGWVGKKKVYKWKEGKKKLPIHHVRNIKNEVNARLQELANYQLGGVA